MVLAIVSSDLAIAVITKANSRSKELNEVRMKDPAYLRCEADVGLGIKLSPACAGLAEKYSDADRRCFAAMHFGRRTKPECLAYVEKFGGQSINSNGSN